MTDKERAALKRLAKKLSAVRATLKSDERALLDRMILGAEAPVKGHQLRGDGAPKQSRDVKAHAMTTGAIKDAVKDKWTDVQAHSMTTGAVKDAVKDRWTDVQAHSMTTGAVKDAAKDAVRDVKAHQMKDAVKDQIRDVKAHQMKDAAKDQIRDVKAHQMKDAVKDQIRDVKAHQLGMGIKPRKQLASQSQSASSTGMLEFDVVTGGYKVSDSNTI